MASFREQKKSHSSSVKFFSLLKSTDADVSTTILKSYQDDIRKKTGTRFMSIADSLAAGKDANEIIEPLLRTVSQFLEKDVTLNDTFMKKALNFQGADGKYRMMNDYISILTAEVIDLSIDVQIVLDSAQNSGQIIADVVDKVSAFSDKQMASERARKNQ